MRWVINKLCHLLKFPERQRFDVLVRLEGLVTLLQRSTYLLSMLINLWWKSLHVRLFWLSEIFALSTSAWKCSYVQRILIGEKNVKKTFGGLNKLLFCCTFRRWKSAWTLVGSLGRSWGPAWKKLLQPHLSRGVLGLSHHFYPFSSTLFSMFHLYPWKRRKLLFPTLPILFHWSLPFCFPLSFMEAVQRTFFCVNTMINGVTKFSFLC